MLRNEICKEIKFQVKQGASNEDFSKTHIDLTQIINMEIEEE